ASVTDPLAVTTAYAARFAALGGVVVRGNARSLHRANAHWRVETAEGPLDAAQAVVALGPFAPEVLSPLGITLPLGIKRGYHRHSTAGRHPPATTVAPVTPRSRVQWSIWKSAIASRRWTKVSGSRPEPSSPPATPRPRRCSSTACCRRRRAFFRSASRSRPPP